MLFKNIIAFNLFFCITAKKALYTPQNKPQLKNLKMKFYLVKGRESDFRQLYPILNKTPELESEPYTAKLVKSFLKDKKRNLVLIAKNSNKIAGFIMAELWPEKGFSYFEDLYISPEFRRNGLATTLMNEYEGICKSKGINLISCLVLKRNRRMHRLSEKLGYSRGNEFYFYKKNINL